MVRLPLKMLKEVTQLAEALNCDRSKVIRFVLEQGLEFGLVILLLRSVRGRRLTDQIAIQGQYGR